MKKFLIIILFANLLTIGSVFGNTEKVLATEKQSTEEKTATEAALKAANPGLERIEKGDKSVMDNMIKIANGGIIKDESDGGISILSGIVKWIKDTLTGFLVLVAVGAFLYIGIKLSVARGNPEEFKKAWMHLIYAVIGVFVISAAWAVVKLVAGINI